MAILHAQGVGTCNEACWEAREDVCRCMCDGRNHGITRYGEKAPGRFCRRKGVPYKVIAIVPDWSEARHITHDITWPDGYGPGKRCLFNVTFEQSATGHMLEWPEVRNFYEQWQAAP